MGARICKICSNATTCGNFNCVLHKRGGSSPWVAAKNGHIKCLRYLHENGAPWDSMTCSSAASRGHLECLEYAHKHGCPWDSDTCYVAALGGHLECLKYAHEQGCHWNLLTPAFAANNGHLECLKYAHEHGCPWDLETCSNAAAGGHIECLEYAHKHGCPWDLETCSNAAAGGHLECLVYAHEHGCPWDAFTCIYAVANGHLECLKYAHKNGAPWYPINWVYYNKNTDCFLYTLSSCDKSTKSKDLILKNPDNILHVALIIYMGGSVRHTIVQKEAQALIDLVNLLRRMKACFKRAAATRIQRTWREYMYRPGGPGMMRAEKRFNRLALFE